MSSRFVFDDSLCEFRTTTARLYILRVSDFRLSYKLLALVFRGSTSLWTLCWNYCWRWLVFDFQCFCRYLTQGWLSWNFTRFLLWALSSILWCVFSRKWSSIFCQMYWQRPGWPLKKRLFDITLKKNGYCSCFLPFSWTPSRFSPVFIRINTSFWPITSFLPTCNLLYRRFLFVFTDTLLVRVVAERTEA